jgi:very-short-patch-repair endonuclease
MSIKETARKLRGHQTPAEKLLWENLRNRKLNSKKFLRQHPIVFAINNRERFFIADFYCAEHGLIIELDGNVHECQKDYDELREWIIEKIGYKIIRFNNEEITNNIKTVLKQIIENLKENLH